MNIKRKNISKFVLISYLTVFTGFNPAIAQSSTMQLRGVIDDSAPAIQLKGGINIDKNKQVININLRESDVKQVLRMLADKSGMNIVFHKSVEGKITLDLVNTSLNKAFEYVMTVSRLTYWQDGNTLIVASKEESGKLGINKTQLRPIQVKYLDAKNVANFLNNNIFSINKPNISVNQAAITNPRTNQVLILGNENDFALAKKTVDLIDVKPLSKTFNINYSDLSVLGSNICTNVFNASGISTATGTSTSGSSSTSTSSSQSNNATGTVIACNASTTNSGGSSGSGGESSSMESLTTNGYVVMLDNDLNQITVSGSKDQINLAEDIIKKFDKKQPQVYIEISIIELSESGTKSLSNALMLNHKHGNFKFSAKGARYELTDRSIDQLQYVEDMFTNLDTYGGGKGVVAATIEALVQQNKGKVLANPRIIATNNKTSKIDITSDYVSKRTINRSTTGSTIENLISYEIADAGIQLDLTPRISPNGYVTLNINPSYTNQKEQIKEGTDIIATLLNKRKLDLQGIRVKDGQTLILGGLIQETESKSSFKIPVLGDIPIVGALFRDSSFDKSKSELILMITPKIIQEEDTANI